MTIVDNLTNSNGSAGILYQALSDAYSELGGFIRIVGTAKPNEVLRIRAMQSAYEENFGKLIAGYEIMVPLQEQDTREITPMQVKARLLGLRSLIDVQFAR